MSMWLLSHQPVLELQFVTQLTSEWQLHYFILFMNLRLLNVTGSGRSIWCRKASMECKYYLVAIGKCLNKHSMFSDLSMWWWRHKEGISNLPVLRSLPAVLDYNGAYKRPATLCFVLSTSFTRRIIYRGSIDVTILCTLVLYIYRCHFKFGHLLEWSGVWAGDYCTHQLR